MPSNWIPCDKHSTDEHLCYMYGQKHAHLYRKSRQWTGSKLLQEQDRHRKAANAGIAMKIVDSGDGWYMVKCEATAIPLRLYMDKLLHKQKTVAKKVHVIQLMQRKIDKLKKTLLKLGFCTNMINTTIISVIQSTQKLFIHNFRYGLARCAATAKDRKRSQNLRHILTQTYQGFP